MNRMFIPAFLCLALAACGPVAGSGALKVRWQIAGWNCLEAEVATVEIQILRNEETVETATEDCSKLEYTFSDLETGTYGVKVTGSNSGGKKTYEGAVSGVEVKDGSTAETQIIQMTQIKGTIYVSWKFSNGELCSFNGVKSVEIIVRDSDSNEVHYSENQCELFNELEPYPGVKIPGLDADNYSIRLYGLDNGDKRLWRGDAVIKLEHGEVEPVKITLNQCNEKLEC